MAKGADFLLSIGKRQPQILEAAQVPCSMTLSPVDTLTMAGCILQSQQENLSSVCATRWSLIY